MQNSIDQLTRNYDQLVIRLRKIVAAYLALEAAKAEYEAANNETIPNPPTAIVNLEGYLKWFTEKEARQERWRQASRRYQAVMRVYNEAGALVGYEAEAQVWHKVTVNEVNYAVAVADYKGSYPLVKRWAEIDPAVAPQWPWNNTEG